MDAIYFLKKRTSFIRFYYDESAKPFRDIQQKIELGHYPFDDPPYSEDEPAFVEQWDNAETGVAVLGHSCVSILLDTLKLYFQTLQKRVIGFGFTKEVESIGKRHGSSPRTKRRLDIFSIRTGRIAPRASILSSKWCSRGTAASIGGDLTSFHLSHEGKL